MEGPLLKTFAGRLSKCKNLRWYLFLTKWTNLRLRADSDGWWLLRSGQLLNMNWMQRRKNGWPTVGITADPHLWQIRERHYWLGGRVNALHALARKNKSPSHHRTHWVIYYCIVIFLENGDRVFYIGIVVARLWHHWIRCICYSSRSSIPLDQTFSSLWSRWLMHIKILPYIDPVRVNIMIRTFEYTGALSVSLIATSYFETSFELDIIPLMCREGSFAGIF